MCYVLFIFLLCVKIKQVDGDFSFSVGPVPEGDVCSLLIEQGDQDVLVENILFADVWVCSGNKIDTFSSVCGR